MTGLTVSLDVISGANGSMQPRPARGKHGQKAIPTDMSGSSLMGVR